jgi:glycosyltransferase involved in cell wall biosynthesis
MQRIAVGLLRAIEALAQKRRGLMFFRRWSNPESAPRTIYFLCPDESRPTGGVKILYRHVDLLNANGFRAFIVHKKKNFRATWFDNATAVVRYGEIAPRAQDFVVFPEMYGPHGADHFRPAKKIVFNQNCYYSFYGYSYDPRDLTTPYTDPDVIAAFVVSEDSRNYLAKIFPDLRIVRIHNSVDADVFRFRPADQKKKLIAFMPGKHPMDAAQVINILKLRGALDGFDVAPIEGKSEQEVAAILGDAAIFLSFGYPEGHPAPPLEAMLSGCMVVGYHGGGGREFFKSEFCRPVEINDIPGFADAGRRAIEEFRDVQPEFEHKTLLACDFVRAEYSKERELSDVLSFWKDAMTKY